VSSLTRFVYLHGFASSPASKKAARIAEAFAERDWVLEVPDLNPPDFRDLTVGGMLDIAVETLARFGEERVGIVGSSLGGFLGAALANRCANLGALVLISPAFDLGARWASRLGPDALDAWQRLGTIPIHHYGYDRETYLGYGFYEESRRYDAFPDPGGVPTLAFHGEHDDIVPVDAAREYATRYPAVDLRVFDDDHSLLASTDTIIRESIDFLDRVSG